MNLLECYILEITSPPEWKECRGVRWVQVGIRYDCYGRISEGTASFKTMEQAHSLKVGDVILQ